MSKWLTVYGLYTINASRTEGYSRMFDTLQAAELYPVKPEWESRIEKHTYEVED